MGCGNSTATSAAAGRGKRGCGAWVPRERQRQRGGGCAVPSAHPQFRAWSSPASGKTERKPVPPVRGRSRPDSARRTVAWVLQRSLHPSGEHNFPDESLVPHIPFPLACIQASPRTPWLPDPAPGKVLLGKSGLFWGWGRVPVCWGRQPAGLRNRIHVGLLT